MNDIMNSFLDLEDRRNNDLKEEGGGVGVGITCKNQLRRYEKLAFSEKSPL